jgi:hypothetical protein
MTKIKFIYCHNGKQYTIIVNNNYKAGSFLAAVLSEDKFYHSHLTLTFEINPSCKPPPCESVARLSHTPPNCKGIPSQAGKDANRASTANQSR